MDLRIFLDKVAALVRFPKALRQYAENIGKKLDDAKRGALIAKLEKEYAEFVALEDKRDKRHAEMIEELAAFKRKNLSPLQRKIEKAEKSDLDSNFDAKLKNMKSPKKKK